MGSPCTIDVDIAGYDEEVYKNIIIAHKSLFCGECNEKIKKGEKYEDYAGKYEGRIFKHVTCIDCISIREQFFDSYCCGDIWENFEDFLYDEEGEVLEECISALTPRAREKVFEMMEKIWKDQE